MIMKLWIWWYAGDLSLSNQLLSWGTEFDLVDDKIAATLEGGHSYPRVAHAHGDETGRMIAEALIRKGKKKSSYKSSGKFLCHRFAY